MRSLQHRVRAALADFSNFLLIKAATHFSMLSHAVVAYPGLVHYLFIARGVVVTPRIVNLRKGEQEGRREREDGVRRETGVEEKTKDANDVLWGWLTVAEVEKTVAPLFLFFSFRDMTARDHQALLRHYLSTTFISPFSYISHLPLGPLPPPSRSPLPHLHLPCRRPLPSISPSPAALPRPALRVRARSAPRPRAVCALSRHRAGGRGSENARRAGGGVREGCVVIVEEVSEINVSIL